MPRGDFISTRTVSKSHTSPDVPGLPSPRRERSAFAAPRSPGRAGFRAALLFAAAVAAQAWASFPLVEPSRDAMVRTALEQMFSLDYDAAERTLLQPDGANPSPTLPYFAGIVCLNRFLDLGDTASLTRAQNYWESLAPRSPPDRHGRAEDPERLQLYRGLASLQLSYLASLRGSRLQPALFALAARRQLAPLAGQPEAKAALMLFDHYRARLLDRIPFLETRGFPAAEFRREASASPHLQRMFLSSLFWIHLDQGETAEALRIAEEFLRRYPRNRLARQMRGDALYHGGRHAEARREYEDLLKEYSELPPSPDRLPLGTYRAAGNLARIYAALGMQAESRARLAEWRRGLESPSGPWLPPSLKRSLAAL